MSNQKYTIKNQIEYIKNELKDIYPQEEIFPISTILFEKILNLSFTEIQMQLNRVLTESELERFKVSIYELKKFKPIQYIFNEADFFGLSFKVNHHVLIPRPETEELVELIIKDYKGLNPQVLDIGTGSGCIAITLAKYLKQSNVYAMDISKEAIEIAKQNAKLNNVSVEFFIANILHYRENYLKFDVIVSNPPYVLEQDKEILLNNVLEYEPHLALFVNDDDPLIFYKKIAVYAFDNLNNNGRLYFEINEFYGEEVKRILLKNNFKNVQIIKDINSKDRIIKAEIRNM